MKCDLCGGDITYGTAYYGMLNIRGKYVVYHDYDCDPLKTFLEKIKNENDN